MERVTWRDRARYAFDNYMARGTRALIVGLFALSVLLILLLAAVVTLSGVAAEHGLDFPAVVWRNLLRTLDPGTMGGDQGSGPFLGAMLLVTLLGIFVISTLIGIINSGLQDRLAELRRGRSRVIEENHTVILGWSQQIHTVVTELMAANANHPGRAIVILAERDPIEMEADIRSRVGDGAGRSTRLIFRSGSPLEPHDLALVGISAARAIVVLAPEAGDPDAEVIRTVLAITAEGAAARRAHVVAELRQPENARVARLAGRGQVELILSDEVVARIVAQTCRQSGLSVVYQELLDFAGDEVYVAPPGLLAGRTFGEALLGFDAVSPIGIVPAGERPRLNPPPETQIGLDDRLIVIAADDDRITPGGLVTAVADADLHEPAPVAELSERTLFLGWNRRAPAIIRQLDRYSPPGSKVTVVAAPGLARPDLEALADELDCLRLEHRAADSADRTVLDELDVAEYDHVIVVCYTDALDVPRADARTLMTLLHLRDIAAADGRRLSIVSELLDLRDRALAEVARADDFIVSDRLISLMIAQVAETPQLNAVFEDLLDPEGAEIYLKAAGDYVVEDRPVPYAAVVEAARRRGEVAIGFRLQAEAADPGAAYGVHLNPPKHQQLTFRAGDRVVVLAER
jgi:Trk K+ transport system NAD-binding subunit